MSSLPIRGLGFEEAHICLSMDITRHGKPNCTQKEKKNNANWTCFLHFVAWLLLIHDISILIHLFI